MECAETATLSDLSYCQGQDAIIHVGELEEIPPYTDQEQLRILFTDMSTGYKTILPINGAELPELVISTQDFSPTNGHVYQVQATRYASGGGITPLRVMPFDVTYTGYTVSTTAYDGFLVRFVRIMTTAPAVDEASEQWFSVP